jgi:hypothetical protein
MSHNAVRFAEGPQLEPLLRNVGVFKKGKASCALKTGKPTTKNKASFLSMILSTEVDVLSGDHDVCFSEARFLGSAKSKAKDIDPKSSSASSSSSGKVHKKKIPVKRKEKLTVPKKRKEIDK